MYQQRVRVFHHDIRTWKAKRILSHVRFIVFERFGPMGKYFQEILMLPLRLINTHVPSHQLILNTFESRLVCVGGGGGGGVRKLIQSQNPKISLFFMNFLPLKVYQLKISLANFSTWISTRKYIPWTINSEGYKEPILQKTAPLKYTERQISQALNFLSPSPPSPQTPYPSSLQPGVCDCFRSF